MEARTKTIEEWFSAIRQGLVALPRFQRFEAWDRSRIEGVLENVLREPSLPIGALLVLEIGDSEPFHSREIVGAPPKSDRPSMHLLDGQQRMTALWRSLTDNYDDLVLFVSASEEGRPDVQVYRRWDRKGVPQPVWAHDPVQIYERNLIPLALLVPGAEGELKAENWCQQVGAGRSFERTLLKFRQRVATYKNTFPCITSWD